MSLWSKAELNFLPALFPREFFNFFTSFLGVLVKVKGSSPQQQLYTSTFSWKSGPAPSLDRNGGRFQKDDHNFFLKATILGCFFFTLAALPWKCSQHNLK